MARKVKNLTIEKGRDKGKTFVITEMPLLQADRWTNRCVLALAASGVDTSNIDLEAGIMSMTSALLQAVGGLDPYVAQELLDELLDCVKVKSSSGEIRKLVISDEAGDVEDLSTFFHLRKEAIMLHLDFLGLGDTQS